MRLALNANTWEIDDTTLLGRGGFARVYPASSTSEPNAVAKFVEKAEGANRDLLMAAVERSRHIVPVLDHGETNKSYVLVMPRADRSLRDAIVENSGPMSTLDAVPILRDIASGLSAMGNVVHRDLKPENILLLSGSWAITDFGISRYAEAATATETHKGAMSRPYAAPEQWNLERATPATDVYAFGVIAYELLAGHRPFEAATVEDLREQHLKSPPPSLPGVPRRLEGLITECLHKTPAARPTPSNLVSRLARATQEAAAPGARMLADANHALVQLRAQQEAVAAERQQVESRRSDLYEAAVAQFDAVVSEFIDLIEDQAPAARVNRRDKSVTLGEGSIRFVGLGRVAPDPWGQHPPRRRAVDVIASATLVVDQGAEVRGYRGRQHSLWFAEISETDG